MLDDLPEIELHPRIDSNLQSHIIYNAKDISYQQDIYKIENISIHSKQTIFTLVHKLSRDSIELPLKEVIEKIYHNIYILKLMKIMSLCKIVQINK